MVPGSQGRGAFQGGRSNQQGDAIRAGHYGDITMSIRQVSVEDFAKFSTGAGGRPTS